MDYNKNLVGCRSGKTIVIDPNKFDGMDSSNNISVPLEDLSIYVQLETTRRARTLLQGDLSFNTGEIKVDFIEGDDVSGRKVLTTRYTDLTTSLDIGKNDNQSLGISSIDIDFNSSQAPMVVINFIDVRGSSVFQNEALLKNKYSTLFQMPYPIFTLTIKGFYGLPVKYDLHMTKFNAKFNSKTGNFEITANFVGYTYAMLSDMLIGYLRAIAHTELGRKKYDDIKKNNPYILTLDELIIAISDIDVKLKKLASEDPSVINYSVYKNRLEQLSEFESALSLIPVNMGIQTGESIKYDFLNVTNVTVEKFNETTVLYDNLVTEKLKVFNDGNDKIFKDNELLFSNAKPHKGLTIASLNQDDDAELLAFVNTNGIEGTFDILDLRPIYKQIQDKRNELEKVISEYQVIVGEKIKAEIATSLNSNSDIGLEPTIRNIVEIFTTSVEVLLSVLYTVSEQAIKSEIRKGELSKYAPSPDNNINRYDYVTPTLSDNLDVTYYPWPEYREKDEKNGFVEAYLGKAVTPSNVDELRFIDDLLNAFYVSLKLSEEAQKNLEKTENLWAPVNPVDTTLFGLTTYPYNRFNKNLQQSIINTIVSRASIFLGLSNKSLNIDDLQTFAKAEVDNLKKDVDDKIIQSLPFVGLSGVTQTTALINGVETKLLKEINIDGKNYYYYNYIFGNDSNSSVEDARGFKLIPLNSPDNSFNFNIDENETKQFSESENLFLTNYTSSVFAVSSNELLLKPDDGSVYLKIFTPEEFEENKRVVTISPSLTQINLSDLELNQTEFDNKVLTQNILPQFGSNYSLPEFFKVNIDNIGESPFRSIFYVDNSEFRGGNTLCSNRQTEDLTKYDLNNQTNQVYYFETNTFSQDDFQKYLYGSLSQRTELGQNRINLKKTIDNQVGVSYPYISFGANWLEGGINYTDISLFGSRFYNAQTNEYAKAFLFLHTFPWNGLVGENISCIFNVNEIINTFGNKGGFVSAPRLWVAFVGGLLWRADIREPILNSNQQIGGGSGLIDPIKFGVTNNGNTFITNYIPNLTRVDRVPNRFSYIHSNVNSVKKVYSMSFLSDFSQIDHTYLSISTLLLQLPEQVKNEFKKVFFDFVNGNNSAWNQIKSKLELINNPTDGLWTNAWTLTPNNISNDDEKFINTQTIKQNYNAVYDNGKKVIDNYVMLARYDNSDYQDFEFNYVSELKDNSDAVNSLLNLIKEEVIISNSSYKIWNQELTLSNQIDRGGIFFPKDTFDNYISFLNTNLQTDLTSENEKQKQRAQQLFGTDNQMLIKFQLYRTCKNIYDKWIGGTESEDKLIFRGGLSSRNGLDTKLAENRARLKGGSSSPTLIDSFRFVTRSFRDIGNELYVNPKEIAQSISINPNNSFYDIVTSLLSQNNFNFIPLPNYINFSDENEIQKMFKPISGLDTFKEGSTGPAFVCVYVGQPSKHLDFRDSYYQHDGIDFRCKDNNLEPINADDFTVNKEDYENNVAVFSVNYGQQNQNIFKDITLDQSEFTETNESLKVIDEIANKGAENRTTTGGQNLYDVYSVRSYKAEVEMMGNAMIQPMMYFQLNNIPMFHGGYLITSVKHSIRPNHMLTNFTGVRVRNVETPILNAASLYMPLLESILGSESASNGTVNPSGAITSIDKAVYPIINTIKENGIINGNPSESGNIRFTNLVIPKGIKNLVDTSNNRLIKEAADSLKVMLEDWVTWMKENQFVGQNGAYAFINSIYRTFEQQENIKKSNGKNAAKPGFSNHGFGIAIDFQFLKKNGTIINNFVNSKPNVKVGYDLTQNESLIWLLDNSYTYGWIIPEILRDDTGVEEFWHFEYHGKSAACILANRPFIKGRQIDTKKPYKSIVKNPLTKDGSEAIYTSCTVVKNKSEKKTLDGTVDTTSDYVTGNAADYWSLVAICALENDNNQGRCDVAQSIYNRLQSGVYGEDTIKGLILASKQYEPVGRAITEFRAIKDRETAIRAFAKSKNTSTEIANQKIQETIDSLKNPAMILSSRNFVGGRTDFFSSSIKNRQPEKGILDKAFGQNVERFNQIFGWFVGEGSKNYGRTNPQPAPKPNFGGLG